MPAPLEAFSMGRHYGGKYSENLAIWSRTRLTNAERFRSLNKIQLQYTFAPPYFDNEVFHDGELHMDTLYLTQVLWFLALLRVASHGT